MWAPFLWALELRSWVCTLFWLLPQIDIYSEFITGLSWLIGGTCQEILSSIIFLFIKHPFDVGDRVKVKDEFFTVKEIRLLSTVFLDKNATLVQAPNSQLTTLVSFWCLSCDRNLIRVFFSLSLTFVEVPKLVFRQGRILKILTPILQMSESITFDVSYKTSFHDIEKLREKMLEFIKAERRDFEPVFDVTVKGRYFYRLNWISISDPILLHGCRYL